MSRESLRPFRSLSVADAYHFQGACAYGSARSAELVLYLSWRSGPGPDWQIELKPVTHVPLIKFTLPRAQRGDPLPLYTLTNPPCPKPLPLIPAGGEDNFRTNVRARER